MNKLIFYLMKKSEIIILIIIILSFTIGIYLYPLLPEKMVFHWNVKGQVNGYISKFWGLFLVPLILIGFWLLFILIPKIDPLKENIKKFRKYFDSFIILITLFLFYLYFLTILWNFGFSFNINQALIPAFGIFFYYSGVLVENSKRNWFIGIRTPWTLSNERVWEKTHRIGGKLFKFSGIIVLLGLFFPNYAIWFILLPIIFLILYTTVYSYFEYQKETTKL